MPDTIHFKTKGDEMRNLAYRHMNGISYNAKHAVVAGKEHTVKHSTDKKRMKIDAAQRKKERKR